jgi:hypothetical protein
VQFLYSAGHIGGVRCTGVVFRKSIKTNPYSPTDDETRIGCPESEGGSPKTLIFAGNSPNKETAWNIGRLKGSDLRVLFVLLKHRALCIVSSCTFVLLQITL